MHNQTGQKLALKEPAADPQRVRWALRLGWLFAEAAGRLKQNKLQWSAGPNRTARLFLSHPHPTTGASLWLVLRQLLAMWQYLYPLEEKKPPVCPPPPALEAQLEEMARWINGEGKASLDVAQTLTLLDEWSRSCWMQLGVDASLLQTAASLGASLGDTYWTMQLTKDGQSPPKKESWRYLLGAERTYRLIEAVREVEDYLSEDTGSLLRHSLWEWGIAEDLGRKSDGALRIAHPWHWARLKKRHRGTLKELTPEEEQRIHANLGKQRRVWDDLLAGRPYTLRPKDLRAVRWVAGSVFVVLAALLGSLTVVGLTGVLALAYRVAVWLFPLIARPTESTDWLAIGGAVVSVLSFCGPLLWRWSQWLFGLYERLARWTRLAKLKQRTLLCWDGGEKSFGLIIWQQLRHPDAQ